MAQHAGLAHTPTAPSKETILTGSDYRPQAYIPAVGVKNIIFRLVTASTGKVILPDSFDNVINPTTKKLDTIRLIKGVYTIWKSEQLVLNLDKEYLKKNRRGIAFENNGNMSVARVPESDATAIEFLKVIPFNIEVGGVKSTRYAFFEYNPAKQAEEEVKKQKLIVEAMQKAFTIEEEKMRRHALYLGVSFTDELGMLKEADVLRKDYANKAMLETKRFMDTLDSPIVTVSYLVKKAIMDAKIDLGRQPNAAYWSNGGFICKMPSIAKAQDYLVEFAMLPTDEGKQFKENLEKVIM